MRHSISIFIAAMAVQVSAFALPSWVNPGEGDWADPSNWGGGSVPGGSSMPIVDNGGTVIVDNGTVVSGIYQLEVGSSGSGSLILNNGTIRPDWFVVIGKEAGSNGTVTVNGGSIVNGVDNNFTVGKGGNGSLIINNDGRVVSNWTFLGGEVHQKQGTTGNGSGSIVLNDSGVLESSAGMVIGSNVGGSGRVEVNDNASMRANNAFYIGYNGDGGLTINGGLVSAPDSTTWVGTNTGSRGSVNLNGGVLEVRALSGSAGSSTISFDGGTLRALVDSGSFINNIGSVELKTGGATIDSNGKNVSINSALSGSGALTKINAGTLTLNASSDIGALAHRAGTLVIANGKALRVAGTTSLDGGSTLQLAAGAGLTTGRLALEAGARMVFDASDASLHVGVLDLESLNGGKVEISVPGLEGLQPGDSMIIFTIDSMEGDYGVGMAASRYFSLENDNGEEHYFAWGDGNKSLILTLGAQIPEPGTYALLIGIGCIGLMLFRGTQRRS